MLDVNGVRMRAARQLRQALATGALLVAGSLLAGAAIAAPPGGGEARRARPDLYPHERGQRVVFSVEAPANASVYVIGDFNDWDSQATPMHYTGDGIWELAVRLSEGDYRYVFLVDGERLLDVSNPDEVSDDEGSSSRLRVLADGRVAATHRWGQQRRHRLPDRVRIRRLRAELDLGADYSFTRVDGSTFWLKGHYSASYDYAPDFNANIGYGWESEKVNFEATLEQPLLRSRRLGIGVSYVDGTGYENQSGIGWRENTLAALLFKHDFQDYYDLSGVEPFMRVSLPAASTFRVSYAHEEYDRLTTQTNWSFFEAGRDQFRPNPPLFTLRDRSLGGAGILDALRLELVHDTRRARHVGTVGTYIRGFMELGDGDFSYNRWVGEGRAYMRLGPPVHVAVRFRAGGRFGGEAMPSQKMFYVGGLGTVRGHEFRSQAGDHEMLGNFEYTLLFGNFEYGLTFLYDAGTAWNSTQQRLDEAVLLQSIGIAFKTSDDDFRVQFAKPVGAVEGDVETTVRLQRAF